MASDQEAVMTFHEGESMIDSVDLMNGPLPRVGETVTLSGRYYEVVDVMHDGYGNDPVVAPEAHLRVEEVPNWDQ